MTPEGSTDTGAMKFRRRTLEDLGDLICGNLGMDAPMGDQEPKYFIYRSSSYLTRFFEDLDTDWAHDGTTRRYWVADVLEAMLNEPHEGPTNPPEIFCRTIDHLMAPGDAPNEGLDRPNALRMLNGVLMREGFEAFYGEDKRCYLRHVGSQRVAGMAINPHRPLTPAEQDRRNNLALYLDSCSEDDLIEQVLLPMFRQLGFHRVTATGHKDKALEYGKDVWMRYRLPTQHLLYFGLQAKRDKLDAAGRTRDGNANIAEIHNQALMMLAHEIFDPETNRRVLVDHAFIMAGGEITKAARNWLGQALDATKRSQIIFMDRDDILNLYTVANIQLPAAAMRAPSTSTAWADEEPF
jgi:hypothetical protein